MKKSFVLISCVTIILCALTGCGQRETASSKENAYTQDLMEQANDAVGYPDITNFFERSQLKEIYELRDNPNLICYWYTKSDITGKWIYQGECIGYGIPSNFFERSQLKEIYELRDNPNLICYWYTKSDITGKWIYQGECIGYGIPYGSSITQTETMQNAALPALDMLGNDKSYNQYFTEILPQAEPNGLYNNGITTSATWILVPDSEGNIKPTYVESEITVSQYKLDGRLCEEWSIPENY